MKRILLSLCLLVLIQGARAQDSINNTGNLQIHTGGTITGFGSFTNTSTASLVNNGNFYIKGNITNDQSLMTAGSGTLYLNGSIAQSVNGSQLFKTNNLVTDNIAGITLNNNLSVTGIHTFTNGLISTSAAPNYMLYEAGSSYSGTNDSRHVTGWVKKYGTTDFVFPVGDNSYERTVAITNLSAAAEIDCHYYTATQNIYNLASPLVQVKANEYWQIDKISGGTGKVTLNWDHSKVSMDNVLISEIYTGQYAGGNWTNTGGPASGDVTTTGTATSNALSSFGPMTFAYTAVPVPVKLISFTGERISGTTFLKWITENEQNVDRYEVQRSYDAVSYIAIGNVAARNSGQREQYGFQDNSSLQGLAYYRLKSVDYDSKFEYSRIVVVSENNFSKGLFVIINPVHSAITIFNRTGASGNFNYKVVNAVGQQVLTGDVAMGVNGGTVLPLPAHIARGMYILELSNGKINFSQKILVEK